MRRAIAILSLAVIATGSLSAHPHVWIDSRVEVEVSENRIEAVRANWSFDPMFTEMIALDYGRGQSGEYSDSEIESIRRGAFENLRHYEYFTHIELNGRSVTVDSVERFSARLNSDSFLEYSFEVPLGVPIEDGTTLKVSMYDETFFTDIAYRDDYAGVYGMPEARYGKRLTRERHSIPIWGYMTRETVEFVFEVD